MKYSLHLSAVAAMLCAAALSAQQPAPPPQQPPSQAAADQQPIAPAPPVTFRVEVNYVEVDALVTDASGNPVVNLTANCKEMTAGAIVPIGPQGFLRDPSKFFPRQATPAEIDEVLKTLLATGGQR